MRSLRLLLVALTALALVGCTHRQQAYYVINPATGQPVPVAQSYVQPQAASPYGQGYAPPSTAYGAANSQALYSSSPAVAQQSYAASTPVYAQAATSYSAPSYAAAPSAYAAAPAQPEGRGLLNGRRFSRKPKPAAYAAPQYAVGGPYMPASAPAYSYASVGPAAQPAYTLDSGDKLRIVVFGQDGITSSYIVGADGNVNLPLVGSVPARGFTTSQLAQTISERLKQGYVREPHVSVEVEANRPFFILGEVTNPGQYPYVANMTAETAVAIAGGFSPRASKNKVELTRNMPGQQIKGDVPLNYPLRPGDTIVVKERWF